MGVVSQVVFQPHPRQGRGGQANGKPQEADQCLRLILQQVSQCDGKVMCNHRCSFMSLFVLDNRGRVDTCYLQNAEDDSQCRDARHAQ